MVRFTEKQNEIKPVDTESPVVGETMTLQFIDEESAVFINTTTGRAEQVRTEEIPNEYLQQELQFQRRRVQNTGAQEIKSKVQTIEKILKR